MPNRRDDLESKSELEFARRVVAGDSEALARMFGVYAEAVFGTALRILKNVQDAEDVVQEIFLSLPRTLRSFEGRGSLEGWIRRVASRNALMKVRKRSQQGERDLGPLLGYLTAAPTVDIETVIALEAAIQSLPDKYRHVYILKEIEVHSHAEVADLIGISERTSRVRLHRARKLLRDWLRRWTD